MDSGLQDRANQAAEQIEKLYLIEEQYLTLKAAKDSKWALMYLGAQGATVKDREADVNSSNEWEKFADALAKAEALFHRERHKLELKFKECDAAHLSLKVEKLAIERGAQ